MERIELIFKFRKSFILIIFVILKRDIGQEENVKFVKNSYSRKRFYVIKQYKFNFVTRLIFDNNLTSDKFVSVWKLRFWASVIK